MAYSAIWDGFDDYNGTRELWDVVFNAGSIAYGSSFARFSAAPNCVSQGMRIGNGASKTKNYNANVTSPIASFAIYFESLPASGALGFIGFYDNGSGQCFAAVAPNGALQIWNFSAGLLGQSAPGTVTAGVYYFVDVIATIGASATFQLYLSTVFGGSTLINLSGVNTKATANSFANQVVIGDFRNNLRFMQYDDFHAHDASGGSPNAILGEGTRIYTKMPNAAGAATNLTPSGAVANYACVNEQIADEDVTYVEAATFPLQDVYGVGAAGFTGTVNGLVRRGRVRKTDAGAHTWQEGIRSSGVDAFATAATVLSSYKYLDYFSATDPNTSSAWAAAAADAASPTIQAAS